MAAEVAYRSDHPAVIAAWAAWEDANRAYGRRLTAAAVELATGDRQRRVIAVTGWGVAFRAIGVEPHPDDVRWPPRGWRHKVRHTRDNDPLGILVPDKRTREGKKAEKVLAALTLADVRLPGMPTSVSRESGMGLRIYSPALHHRGGVVYIGWAVDPAVGGAGEIGGGPEFDATMWTHIKLSEYHTALEAATAPASVA